MVLQLIYWAALGACLLYAFRRGGAPERLGITIIAVGSILSVIVASGFAARFRTVEWGILLVDVGVLIAFLAIALRTDRYWPLWAAGFHTIGVATHVATLADPDVVSRAYALAQGFWAYPMMIAVAIGTRNHQRRSRPPRRGSWRS